MYLTDKDPESLRRKVDIFKTRSKDLRRWGRLQEHERELVEIIQSLDVPIVGADIVEFNPERDPLGVTAMAAVKFLKEIVARMLR